MTYLGKRSFSKQCFGSLLSNSVRLNWEQREEEIIYSLLKTGTHAFWANNRKQKCIFKKNEPQELNPNSSIQVNSNSMTRHWGLTEQKGWKLETGAASWTNTPATYSKLPAEGRGGRQGKHAAHHNAEGPLPQAVAKQGSSKQPRGSLSRLRRKGPWKWGQGGGGCGQREDQTPVARWEVVDEVSDGEWSIIHPSSLQFVLNMWEWSWCGETGTLKHTYRTYSTYRLTRTNQKHV